MEWITVKCDCGRKVSVIATLFEWIGYATCERCEAVTRELSEELPE
jgi:hypothetical protein